MSLLCSALFPAPGATEIRVELSGMAEDEEEIVEGFTEASSSHIRREH